MSIWIRKKRAQNKAAQEQKHRMTRRSKPVLQALALPEDVSGNSVRVILLGNSRALIENYLGVAEIGREIIRLTTRTGILSVLGEELCLADVREGALAVEGLIESVVLLGSGKEAAHD